MGRNTSGALGQVRPQLGPWFCPALHLFTAMAVRWWMVVLLDTTSGSLGPEFRAMNTLSKRAGAVPAVPW